MRAIALALACLAMTNTFAEAAGTTRTLHCVEQATTALAYHEDTQIWELRSPPPEETPDFRLLLDEVEGGLRVTFVRYDDYPEDCLNPNGGPIAVEADGTFSCGTFLRLLVDPTNLTFIEEPDFILLNKKTILPQATMVAGRCEAVKGAE